MYVWFIREKSKLSWKWDPKICPEARGLFFIIFFLSILSQKSINVVLIRANMVAIVEKL